MAEWSMEDIEAELAEEEKEEATPMYTSAGLEGEGLITTDVWEGAEARQYTSRTNFEEDELPAFAVGRAAWDGPGGVAGPDAQYASHAEWTGDDDAGGGDDDDADAADGAHYTVPPSLLPRGLVAEPLSALPVTVGGQAFVVEELAAVASVERRPLLAAPPPAAASPPASDDEAEDDADMGDPLHAVSACMVLSW